MGFHDRVDATPRFAGHETELDALAAGKALEQPRNAVKQRLAKILVFARRTEISAVAGDQERQHLRRAVRTKPLDRRIERQADDCLRGSIPWLGQVVTDKGTTHGFADQAKAVGERAVAVEQDKLHRQSPVSASSKPNRFHV